MIVTHLTEQYDRLTSTLTDARGHDPAGVHQARVATRQLRSGLQTFRPQLDRTVTDPIRSEIGWLAGLLGAARDPQVLRLRLTGMVEDDALADEGLAMEFRRDLNLRLIDAHRALDEALAGERLRSLMTALEDLVTHPPLVGDAARPATKVLRKPVRKRFRQLRRQYRALDGDHATDEDHLLHELRKSAKRLRYAAEAVTPVFGSAAARYARLAESVQDGLGQHQDTLHTRAYLRRFAEQQSGRIAIAFEAGRLDVIQELDGAAAIADGLAATRKLTQKRHRAWFD